MYGLSLVFDSLLNNGKPIVGKYLTIAFSVCNKPTYFQEWLYHFLLRFISIFDSLRFRLSWASCHLNLTTSVVSKCKRTTDMFKYTQKVLQNQIR